MRPTNLLSCLNTAQGLMCVGYSVIKKPIVSIHRVFDLVRGKAAQASKLPTLSTLGLVDLIL